VTSGGMEEYPLDFEHALIAMLKGKVVRNTLMPHVRMRFHKGCFEDDIDGDWGSTLILIEEYKAKWKVVE